MTSMHFLEPISTPCPQCGHRTLQREVTAHNVDKHTAPLIYTYGKTTCLRNCVLLP